jgi:hypothetical protein
MFVSSSYLTKIFDSTRNRQEEIFILPSCWARDFGRTRSSQQTHRLSYAFGCLCGSSHIGKKLLVKVQSFRTGEMVRPKWFGPRQGSNPPTIALWLIPEVGFQDPFAHFAVRYALMRALPTSAQVFNLLFPLAGKKV